MNEALRDGYVHALALDALRAAGRKVVKIGGKQIALFADGGRVHACNNRCPHEGYPLIEGSLAGGHVLTCNWHNWKFDLLTGETLTGGDTLRRYPVRVAGNAVLVDPSDPPAVERIAKAERDLGAAMDDDDYARIARELARIVRAGGDPLDAVRFAIRRTHTRFQWGMTHAHAAAAEWLGLRARLGNTPAHRLVPLAEAIGYIANDCLREPEYAYAEGWEPFAADALVAAIEDEDEARAVRLVRGALAGEDGLVALRPALARAALAHYADFGHALIYVEKAFRLIARLGPTVAEPVLLLLVRSLVNAYREDMIPEFRQYAAARAAWDGHGPARPTAADFAGLSVSRALDLAVRASGDTPGLYDALLGAAADNMLRFDLRFQERTDGPVSQNVGWLGFTHAITFANAARALCADSSWPPALLQLACFVGRNAGYIDRTPDAGRWQVPDPAAFFAAALDRLFDHAQTEYIVSAHLLKTLIAAEEEINAAPAAPWVPVLAAALNRFLGSPLKRKHALRAAHQALAFVAAEG